jgi:hypothetical protein
LDKSSLQKKGGENPFQHTFPVESEKKEEGEE